MTMLSPIFAAHLQQHHAVPRTPTNTERVQAFRAVAPVTFANTRFNKPQRAFLCPQPAPAGLPNAGDYTNKPEQSGEGIAA